MPYSTYLPDMVFPDTPAGRVEAEPYRKARANIGFCPEYRRDQGTRLRQIEMKNPCGNRNATGDRSHNWCFYCVAGYLIWFEDDPDSDSSWNRDKAVV